MKPSSRISVGILTFHRGPNYGGFLQAWHLREAVRSLGHEATLVNYQGERHYQAERIRLRGVFPGHFKGFALHTLKSRPFASPVAELSDHPFATDAELIPWKRFDRIVVGADVVWNFTDPTHGHDPAYFGAHPAQQDTRFAGYAPSCGDTPADVEIPSYVRDGLARFDSIHVRDESTADLVEQATDIRPGLVVDPTWLQDDPQRPCRKIPQGLKYAFVYGHGLTGERAKVLGEFCKKRGLSVVSASASRAAARHRLYSIDPFEWVDLFRRAECVVTSTFHGLLYAIKYNKPVIFMVRGPSRSKSKLAIERCGIGDRVVEEGELFTDAILDFMLNPANGTQLPDAWIRESRELLAKSLG
jgi:hypothetical protein